MGLTDCLLLCTLCATLPPPLTDLHRFPPLAVSYPAWIFACRHCEWLRDRAALYPDEARAFDYAGWSREATDCKLAWAWLDDAHRPGFTQDHRRELLRRLRELLGEEAYQAGEMLPPAPWHRFRRY